MEVWLLWHSHTVGEEDDEKLIGVYSTQQSAEQAQRRPQALLDQEHVRFAEPFETDNRGRAIDHHNAETDQQDGGDEEDLI